jgi:BolA protein
MGEVKQRIEAALNAAFQPESLEITDDSALHAGHSGAPDGGESHFTVHITAGAFAGKSRLERHRLVNAALKDELAGPVHALAVKARAPGE